MNFNLNPHDLVMRAAMNFLGTQDPVEVSGNLYRAMRQHMLLTEKITREQVYRGLRDHQSKIMPPTQELVATVRRVCNHWRHVRHPEANAYVFGTTMF